MKVKINNVTYKILEVDDIGLHAEKTTNSHTLGSCYYEKQEIYLKKDLNATRKYETLCHELTHAFMFEFGTSQVENYNKEYICDFVGAFGKQIIDIANKYFKEKE